MTSLLFSYIPLKDPSSPKHNDPDYMHYTNAMHQQFQAHHLTVTYDQLPKFTFSIYNNLLLDTPVLSGLWSIFYVVWYKASGSISLSTYLSITHPTIVLLHKKHYHNGDPDHKMQISFFQLNLPGIPLSLSSGII